MQKLNLSVAFIGCIIKYGQSVAIIGCKKMVKWEEVYRYGGDSVRGAFSVRVAVVLNRASRPDGDGRYMVAVKVTQGNDRRYFINVPGIRMLPEDFVAMCRERDVMRGRFKRFADIGGKVTGFYDRVCHMVDDLVFNGSFVFDDFKYRWNDIEKTNLVEITPYTLWEQVAKERSAGTEESYLIALRRFKIDMGTKIRFCDFSKPLVARWKEKMLSAGLSRTTANIYIRSLRVVLNDARRMGQLSDTRGVFDGLCIGGRNSYNSRKEKYLSVEQWTRLWLFYESKGEGNEVYLSWREDQKKDRMEALGMMLFMYLADGMNLRDVVSLRYDDYYYQHDRRQLHFQRQKVAERSGAKVVFPVLEPIRIILERQGEKEVRGGLVFGYLKGRVKLDSQTKETAKEIRRLTALYNSTIGDRVAHIADAIGLDVHPTPTWCRHSFASNLIQAGVPKEYITASMAHSSDDTTDNYIDMYSYEQMVDYNSRLLDDPSRKKNRVRDIFKGFSEEELEELRALMGMKQDET